MSHGKEAAECRPAIGVVLGKDPSPVSENDRPADGQSQAESLLPKGDERLEDRAELVIGYADATVGNR